MSIHDADLSRRLNDFLSRRQPPKAFAANEKAQAEQFTAYLKALKKYAPQGDNLQDWWTRFLDELGQSSETWAWPSEREVWNACKSASGTSRREGPGDGWKADPVAINLRRLEAGEPMGDFWLWGRGALQLVAAGADRSALRERRIMQAQHMAEVYDQDTVRAKLAELKAKHERAETEVFDTQRRHRELPTIKPKRAFSRDELEALVA